MREILSRIASNVLTANPLAAILAGGVALTWLVVGAFVVAGVVDSVAPTTPAPVRVGLGVVTGVGAGVLSLAGMFGGKR